MENCARFNGMILICKPDHRIDKTLQRIYLKTDAGRGISKVIITSPKSEKSIREVPISNILFGLFSEWRKKELLCVDGKRYLYRTEVVSKALPGFYGTLSGETNQISCAAAYVFNKRLTIENGADYKIVSELLGHASVNLTLNLYVHPNLEDKRRCVDLIC